MIAKYDVDILSMDSIYRLSEVYDYLQKIHLAGGMPVLIGNMDTLNTLPQGTAATVRAEAEFIFRDMGKRPFIFCSSCDIERVSHENMLAFSQTRHRMALTGNQNPAMADLNKKEITDVAIENMKKVFKREPVVQETLEQVLKRLADVLPDAEFKEFHSDRVHGIEHGWEVTKLALDWTNMYHLPVDKEALAVGAFLHDIKGLGSAGNDQRIQHHIYGGQLAEDILHGLNVFSMAARTYSLGQKND